MAADRALPTWPEIKRGALGELDIAGGAISDALDWLRGIDSPLTPAERETARVARLRVIQAKNLIEQAQETLRG